MKIKNISLTDKGLCFAIIFFLFMKILDGPIRYALVSCQKTFLIYLPIVLMLIFLVIKFLSDLNTLKTQKKNVALFSILSIFFLLGIITIPSIKQVLFGFYIFIPFIFGFVFSDFFFKKLRWFSNFFILLLVVSLIGIIANQFYPFPWEGFHYEFGNITIEASRNWTTFGIKRLAGFSRASFSAAVQIAIFSILVLSFMKSKWLSFILWSVSFYAICLTTTKGIIVAYFFVSSLIFLHRFIPAHLLKLLPYLITAIMLLLPVSSLLLSQSIDNTNQYNGQFYSMHDRFINTWPNALKLIEEKGNIIVGRGLGGIGTPQSKFKEDNPLYNPADNMALYIYGVGGILGILLLMLVTYKSEILITKHPNNHFSFVVYCMLILIYLYGIISNVIESAVLSFFLGIILSYIFSFRGRAYLPAVSS